MCGIGYVDKYIPLDMIWIKERIIRMPSKHLKKLLLQMTLETNRINSTQELKNKTQNDFV
jgi:hypothetical protein